MSLLTDQDRLAWHGPLRKVLQHHGVTKHGDAVVEADILEAIRPLIESAVIAKLAAWVSVEPVGTVVDPTYVSMPEQLPYGTPLYTATAIAATRVQLVNEVVALLRGIDTTETDPLDGWWETSTGAEFGRQKLAAIRALIGD